MIENLLAIFDTFLSEKLGIKTDAKLADVTHIRNADFNQLHSALNNFIKALQDYQKILKKQIDEDIICDIVDVESMEDETSPATHTQESESCIILDNDDSSDAHLQTSVKNDQVSDKSVKSMPNLLKDDITDDTKNKTEMKDESTEREKMNNLNIVQIQASKSEIDRRISAFIEQKRMEVDEHNRKEFCSALYTESDIDDSCARVDSVFVSRVGGKSHIKVSRVVNLQGPQTQISGQSLSPDKIKKEVTDIVLDTGIEERLRNMENHLRIKEGSSLTKTDIYNRLKNLEDRILYLESISPEYFDIRPPKRQRIERKKETQYIQQEQEMSLSDIDRKMVELQEMLRNKATDR